MGKLSRKAWELESKLPNSVRPYTDRLIKTGAKISRKLSPRSEDTQRKGEAWMIRHVPFYKPKKKR